jgi:hypothetical protein
MTGLPQTAVTSRSAHCRATGRNSTPPNAFGITRANMPRTTATLRNPTTSAKRCSGLFAMSSSTRKKLKLSCAPFHDHDVELFMRGYIT